MIISVPRSWNLSHNSLVSSWQSTESNSSQLQEVAGGSGRAGDGVSRSPSSGKTRHTVIMNEDIFSDPTQHIAELFLSWT